MVSVVRPRRGGGAVQESRYRPGAGREGWKSCQNVLEVEEVSNRQHAEVRSKAILYTVHMSVFQSVGQAAACLRMLERRPPALYMYVHIREPLAWPNTNKSVCAGGSVLATQRGVHPTPPPHIVNVRRGDVRPRLYTCRLPREGRRPQGGEGHRYVTFLREETPQSSEVTSTHSQGKWPAAGKVTSHTVCTFLFLCI
jgi:hypothetical protein